MRFMILVKADKNSEAGVLPDEKLLTEMVHFNEELVKAGVMLAGEGLHPSSQGARVMFSGGKHTVVDGPSTEIKEMIAGFWLWKVRSKEEAIEWLKRAPFGAGVEVEIRQVYEPEDLGNVLTPELRKKEERLRGQMAAAQGVVVDFPGYGRPPAASISNSGVDLAASHPARVHEDFKENTAIAEGELTLHLYDLRRETEMRKARNWFAGEFWPRSFSELEQTMMEFQTPQNHWCRQVLSYWDMAAALVVRGALQPGLFYDTCGEAWYCYAKLKPFIQEGRTKFSAEFLANLEKVIEGSTEGRQRLQDMLERMEHFRTTSEESRMQHGTKVSEAA